MFCEIKSCDFGVSELALEGQGLKQAPGIKSIKFLVKACREIASKKVGFCVAVYSRVVS